MDRLPTQVVTLGESLMLFTSAQGASLMQATGNIRASFVGAESNVAIGLARLGCRVRFLTVLGADVFGRHIRNSLRGEGVDVSHVIESNAAPTGVLFKNRRAGLEPEIFYYRSTSAMSKAGTATFSPESWRDASIVYLTGITPALGPSCLELTRHVIRDARQHGRKVWLDPNYRGKLWSQADARQAMRTLLGEVDVILAGHDEGTMLTGKTDPRDIATTLFDDGVKTAIIKSGATGSYCFDRETSADWFAPAEQVTTMVDPIGAGDAFAAGFLSATLEGKTPEDALRRGNMLGAIVCQSDGDWEGLPTSAELAERLARNTGSKR